MLPHAPFLHPLKSSDVFICYWKGALGTNGLTDNQCSTWIHFIPIPSFVSMFSKIKERKVNAKHVKRYVKITRHLVLLWKIATSEAYCEPCKIVKWRNTSNFTDCFSFREISRRPLQISDKRSLSFSLLQSFYVKVAWKKYKCKVTNKNIRLICWICLCLAHSTNVFNAKFQEVFANCGKTQCQWFFLLLWQHFAPHKNIGIECLGHEKPDSMKLI